MFSDLPRRHVLRQAHRQACLRELLALWLFDAREAEVHGDRLVLAVHHDVYRFQVAANDLVPMRFGERRPTRYDRCGTGVKRTVRQGTVCMRPAWRNESCSA